MRQDHDKKRNKGYAAVFFAAGLAVLAAGCQQKAKEPSTAASQTAAETEAETQPPSSEAVKETNETKKAEVKVEGEQARMMSGTVTDAGMSTVTIKNQQYPDGITFLKEDAATSLSEGLLADHEITVFYRGDLKETDTSGVTVELLRDKRENDEKSEAAFITGKVVSVGMSVLTLEIEDGKTVSFEQDQKPVNLTDGPTEEETVKILYSFPKGRQVDGKLTPELLTK